MKLALLLPGYVDSPDYSHFQFFSQRLTDLGYTAIRLDPGKLWETGSTKQYSVSTYLIDIRQVLDAHLSEKPEEVVLIGHSLGGFVALIAASRYSEVTSVISLCPPSNYEKNKVKWKDGIRTSKRELPDNPAEKRLFSVPISFAEDAASYDAIESVRTLHIPLMFFIAMNDLVVKPEDTDELLAAANSPYVVRGEGIDHDFRRSTEQTRHVMDAMAVFLSHGLQQTK